LYDISPSDYAEELMEKIEEDPTDMRKRLELVSLMSNRKKDLTVEKLRDLFLQATLSICTRHLKQ